MYNLCEQPGGGGGGDIAKMQAPFPPGVPAAVVEGEVNLSHLQGADKVWAILIICSYAMDWSEFIYHIIAFKRWETINQRK